MNQDSKALGVLRVSAENEVIQANQVYQECQERVLKVQEAPLAQMGR